MSKKYSPTSLSSKVASKQQKKRQSQQSRTLQKSSSSKSSPSASHHSVHSPAQENSAQITHQEVMQEAIQKASCLIQLLNRENFESRMQVEELNQEVQRLKQENVGLEELNQEFQERMKKSEEESQRLGRQNEELLFQLERTKLRQEDDLNAKEKLQDSIAKNKKLHEKIAFLTKSSTELNREFEQLKKSFKSLQNENQYLLNELKKFQMKENTFTQNISCKENEFSKKLNEIEGTKQAFARRSRQLKLINGQLMLQIDCLRKEKYDLQIISQQSMVTLDAISEKLESYKHLQEKVLRIYDKIKLAIQKEKSQTFLPSNQKNIRPIEQISVRQKLDQIQMLVGYRLQHIQSLMRQICEKVNKPQWKFNLRELGDAHVLAERLKTYIVQLTGNSSKRLA